MRLLAVPPVVSVSTMPLRAEFTAAVTPTACSLIAEMISANVSAAGQVDVRRDVVAIGDVNFAERAKPWPPRKLLTSVSRRPLTSRPPVMRVADGGDGKSQGLGGRAAAHARDGKRAGSDGEVRQLDAIAVGRDGRRSFAGFAAFSGIEHFA